MDQYEILRELGRGGTSVVYLAADRSDGRIYAMKVLGRGSSEPEILKEAVVQLRAEAEVQLRAEAEGQLRAEVEGKLRAEAAGKLRAEAEVLKALCMNGQGVEAGNSGIPVFRECVCDENGDFAGFVMEYVEGRSLQQILEEGKKYSVREAAEAGVRLCNVLARMHRMDPPMIYRDLKPANILVRPDGTWVVVDFGAVRKYREGAGKDTDRLGTEGYAAPEQYGGWEQSDARTDVYGIGAVLHHMITGRTPLETGLRPLEEFAVRRAGDRLPREYTYMAKILLRCCSVAPSMRCPSCAELEKALRGVIRICDKAVRRTNGAGVNEEGANGAGLNEDGIIEAGAYADRIWRKITILIGAAAVFLVCSGMLAASSVEAGKREYRILIRNAQEERGLDQKTEAYRRAVRARPEDSEAHLAFLWDLAGDYEITQEEKDALESAAYTESSLERLREKRPGEYARFEMELGWVYFACYEGGTEAARAAFENAGRTAGLWSGRREATSAMGVVLSEVWTRERIEAWGALERISIREAWRTGEGAFAGAVCKAAVTEIALFPDRYEKAGADEEAVKEVTETAVEFADEVRKGRLQVPDRIREELRAAVECLRRDEQPAER